MLTFKKATESDVYLICDIRNKYAKEYLHDSRTFTYEQSLKWFKENNPNYYIILNKNIAIGYFRISNHSIINKNLYIGADIHPLYCNKGLGYKSYILFLDYIFTKYDLHKVSLEVLETNEKALNLYKKIGFKIEGIRREEVYKNNKYINSILMSLLKTEYYETSSNNSLLLRK